MHHTPASLRRGRRHNAHHPQVRYRSKRDFLNIFCNAPEGALLDKLASVQSTIILGAKLPVVLFTVRVVVGLLFVIAGLLLFKL